MPGYPAVPIALAGAMIVVIYESVKADWVPVIVTLGIFLVGFPYYWVMIRPYGGRRWNLLNPADEEIE